MTQINPPPRKSFSKQAASRRIVDVAREIHADITKKHKKPSMKFPIRSLANVKYDTKRGHFEILNKTATRTLSYNTVKTFAQSMRLLATTKNDLLDKDDIAGKREIYYNSKSWGECRFDEQPESDTLLDDIEAMLGINREQLGYIPEERGGDVAGPLTVLDIDPSNGKDIKIECAKLGSGAWSIPSRVEHLRFASKAKFILAVETASLFQRLVHHRYFETANCILISMSGVPTRACRRFIRRLADDQKCPVLAFTDGDPYGYCNIYRTLKVGSGQAAHINRYFCVPQVPLPRRDAAGHPRLRPRGRDPPAGGGRHQTRQGRPERTTPSSSTTRSGSRPWSRCSRWACASNSRPSPNTA
jgi:DNA topoisomerase-6 subunit A